MHIDTTRIIGRSLVFTCILLTVAACGGSEKINNELEVLVQFPIHDRQILAFDDNPLTVEIVLNSGTPATYTVPPGDGSASIAIRGILMNQTNTIQITWYETLNGNEIELSTQTQTFIADGTSSLIDAAHLTTQYDYDNDGTSNLSERLNGTCVWTPDEQCLTSSSLDVPPTDTSQNSGDAVNANAVAIPEDAPIPSGTELFYSDFSNDVDLWYGYSGTSLMDGVFCAVIPSGSESLQVFLLSRFEFFDTEPTLYTFRFDVKATRPSPLAMTFYVPGTAETLTDQIINITTDWETRTFNYNHTAVRKPDTYIGLNVIGASVDVTYCFDNMRLYEADR